MAPSSSTPSLDSQNDVELAALHKIPASPNSYKPAGIPQTPLRDDYDDDADDGDGGERALLGEDTQTRWQEKTPLNVAAFWRQTSGIVVEVSASSRRSTFPDPTTLDATDAPLHHIGQYLHGGTVRQNIRMSIRSWCPCTLTVRCGQHWKAMTTVNELIAIVPVILNLKGNIEMNLSARLGTASNMGDLDIPSVRNDLILGNLALLQVQAAVVSFVAACVTFFLSTIIPGVGVGEEPSEPLPAETRDSFRHYMRIASQGHPSLRRPRPTPPLVGGPKSGFYECVSVIAVCHPSPVSSHRFMVLTSASMSAACLSAALLGSFMCFLVVLCRKTGRDPGAVQIPPASAH